MFSPFLSLSGTIQISPRINITLETQVALNYQLISRRFSSPIVLRTLFVSPELLQLHSLCNRLQLQPYHHKQLQQISTSGTSQITPHCLLLCPFAHAFLYLQKLFPSLSGLLKSYPLLKAFSDASYPKARLIVSSFSVLFNSPVTLL